MKDGASSRDILDRLKQQIDELASTNDELRHSRQRILAAEEGARNDLALLLHGPIQNRFIVMMSRLRQLGQDIHDVEVASQLGQLLQEIGDPLIKDLQAITDQLYPLVLRMGLVTGLQTLGDLHQGTVVIDVDVDEGLVKTETQDRGLVQDDVKLAVYRIVDEALTNVAKHSGASKAIVQAELSADGLLRVAVRDDGCGFDVEGANDGGVGLALMNDHAEVVGGVCTVHSAREHGTEVCVVVPLQRAEAENLAGTIPTG